MERNVFETATLTDSQPETNENFEQLILKADDLASDGDLGSAYLVYLRASKHKEFKPSNLSKLIDCLVENLKMAQQISNDLFSTLTCEICYGLLIDPVTVDCGHTFCNSCLSGIVNCNICQNVVTPDFNRNLNVLLNKLIRGWIPEYKDILDRRKRVEALLVNKMYNECLEIIEESLKLGLEKHIYLSMRSRLHMENGRGDSALKDAERVINLKPNWIKAHYHLGEILIQLGYTEEAIRSYMTGLSLNPDNPDLRETISQRMFQFIKTSTPEEALRANVAKSSMIRQRTHIHDPEDSIDNIKRKLDDAQLPMEEINCSLCWRMLFEPSTTVCGHTFCKECLKRSLDHSPNCPLCKSSLVQMLKHRLFSTDKIFELIVKHFYPQQYSEHYSELLTESLCVSGISDREMKVPIFVCVVTFPGVRCPLHIFEPRYRLMVRRCIENGSRTFGMVRPMSDNSYANIGTLMYIEDVTYLPDGRSLIITQGSKRFTVLDRSYVDGYNVANVRILEDEPIPEAERQDTMNLHDQVLEQSREWLATLSESRRSKISQQNGDIPSPGLTEDEIKEKDGPIWLWWLISSLPLEEQYKINLLEKNNLTQRLRFIQSVLKYLSEMQQQR
ncbi:DgyrCDS8044 [Dimorphilus gyrociliatus]|uniref:DgyrCDS8044 n=1 Tax=Dimorphilus gyrociliatus TaxID=2664684 RepID=A0A7I8VT65_9ANNE|nr:DgyrCDS8044 [Dimorphilus gyrociliatus]